MTRWPLVPAAILVALLTGCSAPAAPAALSSSAVAEATPDPAMTQNLPAWVDASELGQTYSPVPSEAPTEDAGDTYALDDDPALEDDSDDEDTAADTTYFVVKGSGRALNVTWGVDGSIEQETNVKLPWKRKADPGSIYVISAQNAGGGKISCQFQDGHGEVRGKHTSKGQYAVVTCSE